MIRERPKLVYRGGSATSRNLTPRPEKDTDQDPKGLSTFDRPELAARPGQKAQVIAIDRLITLTAVADANPPGHVSIRPRTQEELDDWAASRGTSSPPHRLTEEVRRAIISEIRI